MTPLTSILSLVVLLWILSGLYAYQQARARQLPEQLPVLSSALQGMLWLRRMLIWSAVSQTETRVARAVTDDSTSFTPREWTAIEQAIEEPVPSTADDPIAADQAQRPKRLPGRPLFGTVSAKCPICQEKTKHNKDAICQNCGAPNRWLTDKWKIAATPASVSHAPGPAMTAPTIIEEATVLDDDLSAASTTPRPTTPARTRPALPPRPSQLAQPRVQVGDGEPQLIALDPTREVEAFDKLPDRPKVGTVKTVCPHCHQRTRHDKQGTCKNCGQPNDWLRKRWGMLDVGNVVRPTQAVRYEQPAAPDPAPLHVQRPGTDCPGCGRRSRPDLDGNCMFCASPLTGTTR